MELRPYQKEALKVSLEKYRAGTTRQLLALPTGMGKTVVFACLPGHHQIPGKTLVLIHREELAEQAADKLRRWNPDLRVGIEMGTCVSKLGDDIVVGSVPTLGRAGSVRIEKLPPDDFGTIVCDEAHHSVAESYKRVFDYFGLRNEGNKKLLFGVTATPNRADGQALGQIYDEIIYQMPILSAIQEGWLSDVRGFRVRTETSLDCVHTRAGDFAVNELTREVNTPYRNSLIAREWLKQAGGLQTLVFTADIQHAKDLAQAFKDYGIAAEAIWGDDPDRAEKLAYHKQGHLKVLTNCAVLTEGYDDWRIQCIVMARPTKSQLLFVQMAGRGTRIPEGINNLCDAKQQGIPIAKDNCLLMDVVDNTTRHSLVTLASIFGLAERLDMKGKSVVRVVKDVEDILSEHPRVDLSKLEDIDKLKTYAEQVDLFTIHWEPEVLEYSALQWFKRGPGSYRLALPNFEVVTICQDLVGKWEVQGTVCGYQFKESNMASLPEAFKFAEDMITTFGKSLLTLLRRAAKWHRHPVSEGQRILLGKFGIDVPDDMTKGQASQLIGKILANKNLAKEMKEHGRVVNI